MTYIRQDSRGQLWQHPIEPYAVDVAIAQALQHQPKRHKPLEGQQHLFTDRVEPAKRQRGESSDQQTLF